MKIQSLLVLLMSSLSTLIVAQGTISGTMIDEKTGEPLMFANVLVEGTSGGATTDFDGKYQVNVEAGTYNVVASYVGYQSKTIQGVAVKDKEVSYLDITLSDESIELTEVVVQAKAIERSENALLILQRKSDKIQDGISSQEMSRYSASSAASALTKITGTTVSNGKYVYIRGLGDRYSLSQLDGLVIPSADPYRNGAQLDLIPANLLDNIITAKTFTPDQPGTFTGGNVNIKTKSFPEQRSFTISLSGGYNPQANLVNTFLTHQGGKNDTWGFDDGTRALPAVFNDPKINEALVPDAARLARFGDEDIARAADQAIRALPQNFAPDTVSTALNHGISLSYGDQLQIGGNPLGVIFSASYNKIYNHLFNYEQARWVLLNVESDELFNQGNYAETLSTETPTLNGLLGLAYKIGDAHTLTFKTLYNHSANKRSRTLFGERPDNILDPEFLEGRALSFNERELSNIRLGGEHVLAALKNARLEWQVSQANSSMYEPQTRFFENVYDAEQDRYKIPASNVQLPFHFYRDLVDAQRDAKLDITIPINEKGTNKIKFGGLMTQKTRTFSEQRYQIEENQPFSRAFTGDVAGYLGDDNIGLIDEQEGATRTRYILANFLVNRTELKNTYEGTEDVAAAYAMLTWNVNDKLKFIGGARVEHTDMFVMSADTSKVEEERTGTIKATDVLPSANLVYSLNERMNLRASYTQTLARPNMREIAPFEAYDPLTKETYFGNINLERTNIQNADLRWEYFINAGELFAVSAYYKQFDNPIVLMQRKSPNPEFQFTNVDQAMLYGVEVELRKNLGFISPVLRDFKFSTNLSYIYSKADVAADSTLAHLEPENRPFEGQAPYIINAALIYSNSDAKIDATLALNSIGDRLQIIGREGTPDIYNRGRSQLDFNIVKRFESGLAVKLSAKNLLNADYVLSQEYNEQEFIYSRFKQGIAFGFGLSYTIR